MFRGRRVAHLHRESLGNITLVRNGRQVMARVTGSADFYLDPKGGHLLKMEQMHEQRFRSDTGARATVVTSVFMRRLRTRTGTPGRPAR